MTTVCCPTMGWSSESLGWSRHLRKGASETVSQPLTRVHQIRSRSLSQPTFDYFLKQLATQPWFGEVSSRLCRFLSYGADWNGYGEKAISERAAIGTIVILHRIGIGGPKPVVVPVYDGGIQIEWYHSGVEIEVEIPPYGPASIYIARPDGSRVEDVVQQMDNPIWDELHEAITELNAAGVE